jgi:serine/threonine protein kinase
MESNGALLCPVCGESAPGEARHCPSCGTAVELHGRYTLRRRLGQGGKGHTYAAWDARTGTEVCVKELSLIQARDFKALELFRRSAAMLSGIDHPAIPKLIEYFEEERGGVVYHYLVQELVDGENLAEALRRGERFDETKAIALARDVLRILRHLHGLSPPVIHRDLKPSNLMRDRGGGIRLIDFDLARDVTRPEGGSTVGIGTPGYASLEQIAGMALPATDLYALGATLSALLARKEPSEMFHRGEARLDVRPHIRVSDRFARILDKLLQPSLDRRYQSADAVLADLDALSRPEPAPRPPPRRVPLFAGVAMLALLAGIGAAVYIHGSRPSPTVSPAVRPSVVSWVQKAPEPTPAAKPPTPPPEDLYAPGGAERVFAAYKARLGGGPVRATAFSLYGEHSYLTAVDPQNPENLDRYYYRNGKVDGPEPWPSQSKRWMKENVFVLDEVNLSLIPELVRRTAERFRYPNGRVTHVSVAPRSFSVYYGNERKNGYIFYDNTGKVRNVYGD